MRSSPRRALARAASSLRARSTASSTSLVLTFMPRRSRAVTAAGFEQVMPVAAVASKPGSVKAQHGIDLSGAQPCYQPLEAGSRHHPTGGPAQIVIDHLDIAEAAASRDIDELVLAPLALAVGLDLSRCGLPNINHGLALQHRGRQEISARHRHAPRPRRGRP